MNELTTLLIKTKEGLRLEESGNEESLLKRVDRLLGILLLPSYKNLRVKTNITNPTFQIDISYDALRIENIYSEDFSATLDITVSGLLGLDTGTEQSDIWYYLWVIAKEDGTVSSILSASATSPSLPSGYTRKRLVGYVLNVGGNFVAFTQHNECWSYQADIELVAGSGISSWVTTQTAVSLNAPKGVVKHRIAASGSAYGGAYAGKTVFLYGSVNGTIVEQAFAYGLTPCYSNCDISTVIYSDDNNVYYNMNAAGTHANDRFFMRLFGFEVPLAPY